MAEILEAGKTPIAEEYATLTESLEKARREFHEALKEFKKPQLKEVQKLLTPRAQAAAKALGAGGEASGEVKDAILASENLIKALKNWQEFVKTKLIGSPLKLGPIAEEIGIGHKAIKAFIKLPAAEELGVSLAKLGEMTKVIFVNENLVLRQMGVFAQLLGRPIGELERVSAFGKFLGWAPKLRAALWTNRRGMRFTLGLVTISGATLLGTHYLMRGARLAKENLEQSEKVAVASQQNKESYSDIFEVMAGHLLSKIEKVWYSELDALTDDQWKTNTEAFSAYFPLGVNGNKRFETESEALKGLENQNINVLLLLLGEVQNEFQEAAQKGATDKTVRNLEKGNEGQFSYAFCERLWQKIFERAEMLNPLIKKIPAEDVIDPDSGKITVRGKRSLIKALAVKTMRETDIKETTKK
jgi:hypothetical protein